MQYEDFKGYFDLDPRQEKWLLERAVQREQHRDDLESPLVRRASEDFIQRCCDRIEDRLHHLLPPRTPPTVMLEALQGRFPPEEQHLLVAWINAAKAQ
jgi:hypothetical protein